jgi:hypothetical protein
MIVLPAAAGARQIKLAREADDTEDPEAAPPVV